MQRPAPVPSGTWGVRGGVRSLEVEPEVKPEFAVR